MAAIETSNRCGFDKLFTVSVPHILEKIFFSLDIKSFDACRKVSKAWGDLLASQAYKRRYEEMVEKRERRVSLVLRRRSMLKRLRKVEDRIRFLEGRAAPPAPERMRQVAKTLRTKGTPESKVWRGGD